MNLQTPQRCDPGAETAQPQGGLQIIARAPLAYWLGVSMLGWGELSAGRGEQQDARSRCIPLCRHAAEASRCCRPPVPRLLRAGSTSRQAWNSASSMALSLLPARVPVRRDIGSWPRTNASGSNHFIRERHPRAVSSRKSPFGSSYLYRRTGRAKPQDQSGGFTCS